MAKASRGVWTIDVGSCSLKAVRLHAGEEGLEVIGFDYLEHKKILSSPDIRDDEREQVVGETLRTFLNQNDIGKDEVAIAIAGQNSFARFIKLPPVEPKKIPEIVQFEAVQQIPFDINEVEWDWQLMEVEGSPDTEVGIFAIKNELISEVMDHFTRDNVRVTCVQIAPMALYNYLIYDRKDVSDAAGKATIILDMGAENTTLVICTRDSVWQRSIRIGGNTFTEAIADAFKLRFAKAEKLKRTAPMSKYMRQIFTAMKPVYTDLGGEIQRSLGFYSSSGTGRDKGFSKIIALGGGMKLQGLTKYLQQSLAIPVIKPDSFERMEIASELSTAKFHENVSDFGIVYGLGAQMLGEAKIDINLLPRRIARTMTWTRKARMFTVAASVLLAASLLSMIWAFKSLQQYNAGTPARNFVAGAIAQAREIQNTINTAENAKQPILDRVQKQLDRFDYRQILPELTRTLLLCFPNQSNTPDQYEIFEAFVTGDVQRLTSLDRSERKMMFITRLQMEFAPDLSAASFPEITRMGSGPGISRMGYGGMGEEFSYAPRPTPRTTPQPTTSYPGMDPYSGDMEITGEPLEAVKSGFVVVFEGYSPYKNITALLDPPGVGSDKDRWGVVTRFMNLSQLFPDSPFEIFDKNEITHFEMDWGVVEYGNPEMPSGIGIVQEVERVPTPEAAGGATAASGRYGGPGYSPMGTAAGGTRVNRITREYVLLDPMTNEEISKVYDIITQDEINRDPDLTDKNLGQVKINQFGEEMFIERDHWFRIRAKFVWKDAPAVLPDASGVTDPAMYPGGGMDYRDM